MSTRRTLVPFVAFVGALVVLGVGLGNARGITFDEYHYLPEARDLLAFGAPTNFPYHPPLGKLFIAAGMWVFGDVPLGWRAASVLAGAASVAMTFCLARRLLRDERLAGAVALLLLCDGMFTGLSRAGMLDVFVLAGFLATTLVALAIADAPDDDGRRRPWLLLGGTIGLTIAVKWAALVLVAAPVVVLLLRRGRQATLPSLRTLFTAAGIAVLSYTVTWTPWIAHHGATERSTLACQEEGDCDTSLLHALSQLPSQHVTMVRSLEAQQVDHSQRSVPWTWSFGWRPMLFFEDTCSKPIFDASHCVRPDAPQHRAAGLPNVPVWWTFLAAVPALAAGARRREGAAAVALLGWAIVQFPFLLFDRTAFIYWFAPALPFVCLGAVWAAARSRATDWLPTRWAIAAALPLAAIGLAVPERVPQQAAFLGLMGWVIGAAVGVLRSPTQPPTRAGERQDRRPLLPRAAAIRTLCLVVPALLLAVVMAPVVRARPLPPGDWRVDLVDDLLLPGRTNR